jgi:hypothetical protein
VTIVLDVLLLLPSQKNLLVDLVEAAEQVPLDKRSYFTLYWSQGDGTELAAIKHPGFEKSDRNVFRGDVDVLTHYGLLLVHLREGKQSYQFTLLPNEF